MRLFAPITKAVLSALSEHDPELRDTESVPLAERVEAFFEREVKPHVPDAWIDISAASRRTSCGCWPK